MKWNLNLIWLLPGICLVTGLSLYAKEEIRDQESRYNPDNYEIYPERIIRRPILNRLSFTADERDLLSFINSERNTSHRRKLNENEDLLYFAREHCHDMILKKYFDHYDSNGDSIYDRLINAGLLYSSAKEIILQSSESTFMEDFKRQLKSDKHYLMLLESVFEEAAVAIIYDKVTKTAFASIVLFKIQQQVYRSVGTDWEIIESINRRRFLNNTKQLEVQGAYSFVAYNYVLDMIYNGFYGPKSPSGETVADRIKRNGLPRDRQYTEIIGRFKVSETKKLNDSIFQEWDNTTSVSTLLFRSSLIQFIGIGSFINRGDDHFYLSIIVSN